MFERIVSAIRVLIEGIELNRIWLMRLEKRIEKIEERTKDIKQGNRPRIGGDIE